MARNRLALDGATESQKLTTYPFLNKSTRHEIMTMKEIAAYENTDNPKEAIRRLVEDAK